MFQTCFILARNSEGEHFAITVNGAKDIPDAWRRASSSSITLISVEDSHQIAAQKSKQLNAATGIVPQGCSSC